MDPRVQSAIEHWAPRFVANGVPLTDFQEVTGGLRRWEDWCAAWTDRGAHHEQLGREALEQDRRLTAGRHLTTAAVCYHFGKYLFVVDPDQMRATHARAVACRTDALGLLRPPGERVAVPFEGTTIYGNLRRPDGDMRPPVVVMCMGLDSAKEEMDAYEDLFLERGMATFAFDGPGQGEAEYELAIRHDFEAPVAAVIDQLERRDDVDAGRLGLWGVSLGGYYAPRAAAFEPRVRACVSLSGPYDFGAIWHQLPALTREAFRHRAKAGSDDEARAHAATLSLAGVASRIACPLFAVAGGRDRIVPPDGSARMVDEAAGDARLLLIDDGNHVANNRAYRYRYLTADWMAERLSVA